MPEYVQQTLGEYVDFLVSKFGRDAAVCRLRDIHVSTRRKFSENDVDFDTHYASIEIAVPHVLDQNELAIRMADLLAAVASEVDERKRSLASEEFERCRADYVKRFGIK